MAFKKGVASWNKGKSYTYEELYGKENAEDFEDKLYSINRPLIKYNPIRGGE